MNAIPITGPAVEPVALADMRAFLRLDDTAEDDLVAALVRAARQAVEAASGRLLIAQVWRLSVDRWPEGRILSLPLSPLIAVDAIRILDASGAATPLAPALYTLDLASDPPGLTVEAGAPSPGRARQGIEIDLRAGYGAAAEGVPGPLRHAVRLLAARWFESRGDQPDGAGPLPPDVLALLAPFRRLRL